jgi:hypothetical protein
MSWSCYEGRLFSFLFYSFLADLKALGSWVVVFRYRVWGFLPSRVWCGCFHAIRNQRLYFLGVLLCITICIWFAFLLIIVLEMERIIGFPRGSLMSLVGYVWRRKCRTVLESSGTKMGKRLTGGSHFPSFGSLSRVCATLFRSSGLHRGM